MNPVIDDAVEVGAAGRGQGVDWIPSLTFDTEVEVKSYLQENKLSKCRTNHNIGTRVHYLKCITSGCPYRCRLLENLVYGDEVSRFELEIDPDLEHNHQVDVARERGLTPAQKAVIRLSIERGQAAPKKVRSSIINACYRHEDTKSKMRASKTFH